MSYLPTGGLEIQCMLWYLTLYAATFCMRALFIKWHLFAQGMPEHTMNDIMQLP